MPRCWNTSLASSSQRVQRAGYRDWIQRPVPARLPARDFAGSGGLRTQGSEERRRDAAGRRANRGSVPLCRHADENLKSFKTSKELCQTKATLAGGVFTIPEIGI